MRIAFAGFRHDHVMALYRMAESEKEIEIAGCLEENAEVRLQMKERYPELDFKYEVYEQILEDETVEAVCICDYYAKRGNLIIRALQHGKHIVADKPLCTDPKEMEEIIRLAGETGLQVFCMLELRFQKAVQKARELVGAGVIGKVKIVDFTGQHCLNYGSRPGWYFEEGKHGGTINDIAVHGIDVIRYITGEDLTEVVAARTWNAFALEEPEFEDCGQLMVQMGDIAVMADVSYAAPRGSGPLPTFWEFTFWGQAGMIRFNYHEDVVHLFKDGEVLLEGKPVTTNCMKEFLAAVEGRTEDRERILDTASGLKSAGQTLRIQGRTLRKGRGLC